MQLFQAPLDPLLEPLESFQAQLIIDASSTTRLELKPHVVGVCLDVDNSKRGTHVCATMPPRNLPIAEDIHAIAYCETCNCNIAGDVTQCCCLSMATQTAQMRHQKLENIGKGSPVLLTIYMYMCLLRYPQKVLTSILFVYLYVVIFVLFVFPFIVVLRQWIKLARRSAPRPQCSRQYPEFVSM